MSGQIYNWAETSYAYDRFEGDWLGQDARSAAIEGILDGDPSRWTALDNPVQSFRAVVEDVYFGKSATSPMVFISHRQTDAGDAITLAKRIVSERREYDVWLDVWDPTLSKLQHSALPDKAKGMLIALSIEMGLLNSTYLVALITENAAGSAWIPYEYGRVKPKSPFAVEVAARLSRGVTAAEYLHLGAKVKNDDEVINWLP